MRSQYLGLVLLSGALAQTFTDCDPTKVDCPADRGIKDGQYSVDFTQGENPDWIMTYNEATYDQNGVGFTISGSGQAPTMQSDFYVFFGSISAMVRAAPGTGIISCVILESDCLDEIDWEWLGGDAGQVQTNYFGKGNTTTYDRGAFEAVADNQATFHNYTIEWTADFTRWLIDGAEVRVLNFADAVGGSNYPQTPMRIKLGNWNAADTGNAGTIQWAGGEPDFNDGKAYSMYVQRIDIVNYNPAASYSYGDKSGSWQSIVKSDDEVATPPGNETPENAPITGESTLTDDSENQLSAGGDASATTSPAESLTVTPSPIIIEISTTEDSSSLATSSSYQVSSTDDASSPAVTSSYSSSAFSTEESSSLVTSSSSSAFSTDESSDIVTSSSYSSSSSPVSSSLATSSPSPINASHESNKTTTTLSPSVLIQSTTATTGVRATSTPSPMDAPATINPGGDGGSLAARFVPTTGLLVGVLTLFVLAL